MAHVLAKDLRDAVLQAAIQGKLTEQLETDTSVAETLKEIAKEKAQLVKQKKIRKSKSSSLIQENEKLYDIPYNWSWCRLKDVTYNFGQKKPESKFCYIDVSSINSDKHCLNRLETVVEPSDASSRARKIVVDGDVIFATIRPYLKNICIIDKQFTHQPIVSTAFAVMHCGKGLNNKYLFYYLLSASFMSFVNSGNNSKGVAYPAISENKFFDGLIAFPPIEEQARIVAKVDEIMAKIDEYEKLENQLVKLKEQFPQDMKDSLLQAGMTGKLTEQYHSEHSPLRNLKNDTSEYDSDLPSNWSVAKMMTVSELYTGNSISESIKKSKYTGLSSGYNYIGTKDVGFDCSIAYNNGVKIPYDEPKFKIAKKHSTLLCIEGGSAGKKVGITSEDVCFGNKLCSFNAREYINYKFQFYVIQSPTFKKVFIQNKSGMIGGVSIKKLKEILIPLPPIEEQQRVVDKLDELLPLVDKLAELN